MQKRREKHFDENHDFFGFSDFETHLLGKFSSKFWFLSLISSRSRRNLASREERIQKFIHTAFFWPVEVGKILMRLLIVILNKLVRIISRRNRLVSKIALGDHLVGWSSIRGLIFRSLRGDLVCIFVFLTRARARRVFRAREGFGDISGEGGVRPTISRFSKNAFFLREFVAGCILRPFTDVV